MEITEVHIGRYVEDKLEPHLDIVATAAAIGVGKLDMLVRPIVGEAMDSRTRTICGGQLIRHELEVRLRGVASAIDDKSWTIFHMPGGIRLRTKRDVGSGSTWAIGVTQMMFPQMAADFLVTPDVTLAWSMDPLTGGPATLGLHMYDSRGHQFWSLDLLPRVNETVVNEALSRATVMKPAVQQQSDVAARRPRFRRVDDEGETAQQDAE